MAFEQLPGVYKKLSGKNKKMEKILDSKNVKNLVDYGATYGVKNYIEKPFAIKKFFAIKKIYLIILIIINYILIII